MNIIPQSHELLLDEDNPVQQIGKRARICYKSEDKAKEDETGFVKGIIKAKHNSCLEMATIHLRHTLTRPAASQIYDKLHQCRYLNVSSITVNDYSYAQNSLIISGSVRAFREFLELPSPLANDIGYLLHKNYPTLFNAIQPWHDFKLELFDIELLDIWSYTEVYKKHHFQAVKFITNRAVSHELVRHRPVAFLQESQRYCNYRTKGVTFIAPTAFDFGMEAYELWTRHCTRAQRAYLELIAMGKGPQAARTVLPNSCKTEIIVYCSLRQWEHIFFLRCSPAADPSMQEAMFPVLVDFQALYPYMFENPRRLE